MRCLLGLVLSLVIGCSSSSEDGVGASASQGSGDPSGAGGSAASGSNSGGADLTAGSGAQSSGGASGCEAPDLLVVLDRTLSMHKTPSGQKPEDTPAGHATSKWHLAVTAVEEVSAPPTDDGIRFGLELFPRDPGGGQCITLSERIQGATATNTQCEHGEVLVEPALAMGAEISSTLDPETTLLCISTPIGAALQTAQEELATIAEAGRQQFVLFVTDGGDTCADKVEPIAIVKQLAAAGVYTYVVGFGSQGGADGVNVPLLNHMACAGRTAKDFTSACVEVMDGYDAAAPDGPALFYDAADGTSLSAGLQAIAGEVCCDCVPE